MVGGEPAWHAHSPGVHPQHCITLRMVVLACTLGSKEWRQEELKVILEFEVNLGNMKIYLRDTEQGWPWWRMPLISAF